MRTTLKTNEAQTKFEKGETGEHGRRIAREIIHKTIYLWNHACGNVCPQSLA